jgi:hypothetical protein
MHKAQKTEVATIPELKKEDGTAAPHWKRNLAVCVFGSFTTIVSLTLVVPFLPLYVEQLGVQGQASIAEWSGACFAAAFFTAGLVAPLWGKLAGEARGAGYPQEFDIVRQGRNAGTQRSTKALDIQTRGGNSDHQCASSYKRERCADNSSPGRKRGRISASFPATCVRPTSRRGRLVRLFPEWRLDALEVNIVFPSRRELSPVVRAFVDFMRAASKPGALWQDDPLSN